MERSKIARSLLVLVMILSIFAISGAMKVSAASDVQGTWGNVYWEFKASTGTLTFTSGGWIPEMRPSGQTDTRPWYQIGATDRGQAIKKIVFEQPIALPANSMDLFKELRNLQEIEGLDKLDISNVTSMSGMFRQCQSLENIDSLANWNVSNVNNMSAMFTGCMNLKNTNALRNWDVSNVTDISGMFYMTSNLENIDALASWKIEKVTDMSSMLSGSNIENADAIKNWGVSKVTNLNSMFSGCANLKNIDALENWDISNATSLHFMFNQCTKLENINALANWKTKKITDISAIFQGCAKLNNIDGLVNWDVSNVTNMSNLFIGCSSLENIKATEKWDTKNVVNMRAMFHECVSLKSIDLSSWDMRKVDVNNQLMGYMFTDCSKLQSITLGEYNKFPASSATSFSAKLPAIDTTSGKYTGEWIGINTGTIYSSSDDFMAKYDGSNPDTYVWRKTPTYSVTYKFVSGTAGMPLPANVTSMLPSPKTGVLDTDVIVSPDPSESTVTVPLGTWTFQGWDKKTVTISGRNEIVEGTWTYTANPVKKYSVTYYSNTGDNGAKFKIDHILENDTHTVLNSSHASLGYSRDGYNFKGWNTQADGKGTNYAAGDSIHVRNHISLYAQWEKLSSEEKPTLNDPKPTPPNEKPSVAGASTKTEHNVNTGDQTNIGIMMIVVLISLGLLGWLAVTEIKRKRNA